jgi:hypothetical protein
MSGAPQKCLEIKQLITISHKLKNKVTTVIFDAIKIFWSGHLVALFLVEIEKKILNFQKIVECLNFFSSERAHSIRQAI